MPHQLIGRQAEHLLRARRRRQDKPPGIKAKQPAVQAIIQDIEKTKSVRCWIRNLVVGFCHNFVFIHCYAPD